MVKWTLKLKETVILIPPPCKDGNSRSLEQFSFIWAKKCWRKGRIILESVYFCVFCFQYAKSLLQINNYNEQLKFGFPFANLLRSKTQNCSFVAHKLIAFYAQKLQTKVVRGNPSSNKQNHFGIFNSYILTWSDKYFTGIAIFVDEAPFRLRLQSL